MGDAPDRLWLDVPFRELFLPGEEQHGIKRLVEYHRATPASAARLLLESPEAVERMAFMMDADAVDPEKVSAEARNTVLAALRAIAGEEG